jgi:hypothetical protein
VETLAGAWALILWAVLVMIVSVVRRRRCLRDAARPIRRGRQSALLAGALVIAAVAPAVGAWHGRFAFGLLLAGPIFCLVMAAGSLVTELLVRRVAAPRRRATLAARHFLNYVDRPQLIAVCAVFAVATAFLAAASFFGDSDDKGRPGRFLRLPNPDPDPRYGGWSILWPGAYYALPLLAALGLTLLTTAVALRRIAARPRVVTADGAADPVVADERARRRSATVVLAAAGVAPAAALCGAGLVAAAGMTRAGAPWNVLGMLLWVVVAAAAAIGAWSAAVLVTPDRGRRTHPAPATA